MISPFFKKTYVFAKGLQKPTLMLVLFCLNFLTSISSTAQNEITIFGKAPAYSGHSLVFYHYQNFINQQPEELCSTTVSKNGRFELTFELSQTTYAFTNLGKYRVYIFLEPGNHYNLVLPPYSELSIAQKLNPFFEPELLEMGLANRTEDDLNHMIRAFDEEFNTLLNTNALSLFSSQNIRKATSITNNLEERFTTNNVFFNQHKRYHYARLQQLASRRKERQIIYKYFSQKQVLFHLPAYWKAFKEIFTGEWESILPLDKKETIYNKESEQISFTSLSQTLATDSLFTRADLRESVLIWLFHEAFYKKTISEKRTLCWMEQASQQASTGEVRKMASSLFLKMNQLRPGTQAPSFNLKSLKNKTRSLEDYQKKFVYLNFMHTQNHSCQKAIETLGTIAGDFKRDLKIVTILIDDDFQMAKEFLSTLQGHPLDILFINNKSSILNDYNIKAVPTYFLINPEGKIALSPAPSPHEGFREVFSKQHIQYHRQQQRKQPQRERSIIDF